ncbi:SDR family NAD(P)-dependent oxidoreductase [Streptomyces sp. NPDC021020]|uniref:SDR family NAD(P)-dependent oxidoreductase n=1 Tax=Streptomyces sp. NPDC021020 TaxID=3365109 RepID=UPI0037B4E5BF
MAVTGAGGGIGNAPVREFARRGARIGPVARGRAGLEAAAREVREPGGEALVAPVDVADPAAVMSAAEAVERAFGPLDVWVNGAFDEQAHDHAPQAGAARHAGVAVGVAVAGRRRP